jgi:hypothetical protein
MLIRIFRATGPGLIVLIILAGAALWANSYLNPVSVNMASTSDPMPLWAVMTGIMSHTVKAQVITAFVLMLLICFLMVRFNISLFFINRRTFLPGLLYVLLYSVFPLHMVFNPALPAALLIMIALWRMMDAYRKNGVAYNFFDAALLISAASLFYGNAIWFLALVFVGTLLLRSPDLREIFVAIIGALLPYAFLYAIWYLTNKDIIDLNVLILNNLFEKAPQIVWGRTLIILLAVVGLNFIIALYMLLADITTKKVKSRKTFSMLLWLLVIVIAVFATVPSASVELMAIAAIPAAFVISDYYVFARKIILPEILFTLLIIMMVIARVWP